MPNDIPQTDAERMAIVSAMSKRYAVGVEFMKPFWEDWVRYYKLYHGIKDAAEDSDEPNTALPYAFAIIEDIVPRATESLFKLKPPCKVRPRRLAHKQSAENFAIAAKTYFASSEYQLDYTESCKEEAITGNAWEMDEWRNRWAKGTVWKKVKQPAMMDSMLAPSGQEIPTEKPYDYEGWQEVEQDIPLQVGYHTQFPSVFSVIPEPNKKKVDEMKWLIHDCGDVSLEEMRSERYRDPATGEMKPVYDLTELERAYGPHENGKIQPEYAFASEGTDYEDMVRDIRGRSSEDNRDRGSDQDTVWIVNVYEPGLILTIAQGKFLIRRVVNPHHRKPRIPFRLRRYSPDKEQLFGIGAIEPIEDSLYEFDDIHNLSMSNWVRIINGMLAVRMDRLYSVDDLKPRPGGRIRIKGDGSVHDAISAVVQQDVAPSMLAMESNIRGLIEKAVAVSDLSPGVDGTKQTHKTLGGLLEIQSNMATRFATLQRIHLACYQAQMDSMEAMFSQYQIEPIPYYVESPHSSTITVELGMEDFYTEGIGFDYIIEIDPSFGDDQVQRTLLLGAFDLALKYEQYRLSAMDAGMEKVVLSEIMKRILLNFGWSDTSEVLKQPDGLVEPDREFEMMLAGLPVQVQEGEDLVKHLLDHVMQRMSPKLLELVQAGKAPPSAVAALDEHIAATRMTIQQVLADPMLAVEAKMRQAMMSAPMSREVVGAA